MRVTYRELNGELKAGSAASSELPLPTCASVIRSNISGGEAISPRLDGLKLSFVGRGSEHYRIAGRHYRVGADQFMISPQRLGSEVVVRRGENPQGALGLCVFLPHLSEEVQLLVTGPIVLPAQCPLGVALGHGLSRLIAPSRSDDEAVAVADQAQSLLGRTLIELDAQVAGISREKRTTQFETVRRMNLAKSYLHHVVDRAVSLNELASEVAVSPYHLLRSFRDCFGETPANYHRRLRLNLACQFAHREGLTYDFVSDRFGFAGGSSFNHAYKRTFGQTPRQDRLCQG